MYTTNELLQVPINTIIATDSHPYLHMATTIIVYLCLYAALGAVGGAGANLRRQPHNTITPNYIDLSIYVYIIYIYIHTLYVYIYIYMYTHIMYVCVYIYIYIR